MTYSPLNGVMRPGLLNMALERLTHGPTRPRSGALARSQLEVAGSLSFIMVVLLGGLKVLSWCIEVVLLQSPVMNIMNGEMFLIHFEDLCIRIELSAAIIIDNAAIHKLHVIQMLAA